MSVPKGGGAIPSIGETFSANAATGTGSLSVPLATSSGRGGFNLGLALNYDSGVGNGPFGLGWRLSPPSVARKTDKGVPRYLDDAESDVFVLCGAEDLVPVRTPESAALRGEFRVRRYRPRVEAGFARIERWTHVQSGETHWRTTDRDNVMNIFGRTAQARIADPAQPGHVFLWLLEETRDDRGNVVRYTYKAEDGAGVRPDAPQETSRFVDGAFAAGAQRYLKRIEYGNVLPDDASRFLFEVVFDYGEHDETTPQDIRPWPVRDDPFSTYRPGFELRTYRLCRRVLMFHRIAALGPEPYLVRATDLHYAPSGHLTSLVRIVSAGYAREADGYARATLPPLELEYSARTVDGTVRRVAPDASEGIAGGVDGKSARWLDLDGEGAPGVLLSDMKGWYYKSNLGHGHLSPPVLLRTLPVPAVLDGGVQQLVDLEGAGRPDLVQYASPLAGYFERTEDGNWRPFASFPALPRLNWRDPNLRFLDADGDGLADIIITQDQAIVWYRSRGKEGFEPPQILSRPKDEREGPAILFADGSETIYLADMSGDGLVDIVRIRNGEVCFWPNLGRGHFGRRVTLAASPWFDTEDQFDPRRIRLADLDGSGTTDLIYLAAGGVRLYFNESGNRLSAPIALGLPLPHSLSTVGVVDLLGRGTACIVWSSPLPADGIGHLHYVDVMGGAKPYLLTRLTNGRGGETRLSYSTSTQFYLDDKAQGRHWITRLPFPVHVVAQVERFDHVARTRLVTRYRYRHGYYDAVEREYRGFAYVEQHDAETVNAADDQRLFPDDAEDRDGALDLPPVVTRTWFHTGAWFERERMESALAREYYRGDAPRLEPPPLPPGLTPGEEREAARAARGRILRQEIYAEDGLPQSIHPYSVTEQTCEVRLLERAEPRVREMGHAHAAFLALPAENLTANYERRPDDPRVQHQMVLEVDDFGNVLRSAALAYPRHKPRAPEQGRLLATLSDFRFANRAEEVDWYRIGVAITSATSELTGLPADRLITRDALRRHIAQAREIAFEDTPSSALERRVIARSRSVYYRDDLSGPLPPGEIESRALPFQSYHHAFTAGLVARIYGEDVDRELLSGEAAYVRGEGGWWVPSGRAEFDPAAFYQPVAAIDAFGRRYRVRYDVMALLVVETEDPLGNTVAAVNDYRVLGPRLVTDANANRTAVAFDALALPVRIAQMGKGEGDTLDDPTMRLSYDLHRFVDTGGRQPVFTHMLARETHGGANRRWQETYVYGDGFGREAMRKVSAAPGPVPLRDADGRLRRDEDGAIALRDAPARWSGTGRTVFDNKGNAIKKYEPFFSDTFEFETDRELTDWGVTPIMRYDPLGRLIRTDLPNGTLRRVTFDAWGRENWDQNDTVLQSRWYAERGAPDPAAPEPGGDPARRAAWLAAQHAATPSRTHLDPLGRGFLAEADNKDPAGAYLTRTVFDISGDTLAVVDARGNSTVDRQMFDMLGRPLFSATADGGWSRILPDVEGKSLRGWDARGTRLRYAFDALRRPTHIFAQVRDGEEMLVARHVYGEGHPEAIARNLRTQAYQTYDGAGVATNLRFDFKGNILNVARKLAVRYRETCDWSALAALDAVPEIEAAAAPLLESETFAVVARYDALNRLVSQVTPDGSDTRRLYDAGGRLDRIEIAPPGGGEARPFVESITYNARGQRLGIRRGNQTVTTYDYDPATFLLRRLMTGRGRGETLQDLAYECDAVGNIVQLRDEHPFVKPAVPGGGLYTYDPLYRLTHAEGREHPGQMPSFDDARDLDLAHRDDFSALRRYRETYVHDPVGNILRVSHRALSGPQGDWTRHYDYAEDSNRLLLTGAREADGSRERYAYDAQGNMSAMAHLAEMRWDHADRLVFAERTGGGHVWFVYDGAGKRVRKVYEHGGLREETIYLGGYEVYRRHRKDEIALERQTLHVMDGDQRVAMIERQTVDSGEAKPDIEARTRYVLDNHLGSSMLEVDDAGQVITYEEYFPFGATALRAADKASEVSAKRYRYTGQERDEETGLYYYGARYYAAWIGRWTSCDPERADLNLFAFVRGNPISRRDMGGGWDISWSDVGWAVAGVVAGVAIAAVAVVAAPIVIAAAAEAATTATIGVGLMTSASTATVATVATSVGAGTAAVVETGIVTVGAYQTVKATTTVVTGKDPETGLPVSRQERLFTAGTLGGGVVYGGYSGYKALQSEALALKTPVSEPVPVAETPAVAKTPAVSKTPSVAKTPSKALTAPDKGGVSVASGGTGGSAPAKTVRIIQHGEKVADIVNEGKALTFTTGNEHAVVKLPSGERALVSGGPGGIDFPEGSVTKIFGHTHPTSAPPSAADFKATAQLGQTKQYVFHGGQVTVVRPKP